MKRLMVVGYWRHNLGDDLFLKLLMERYPSHEIVLTCKGINRKYYQQPQVKVCVSDAWYQRGLNKVLHYIGLPSYFFLRYARQDTIFIILGGSLFIEQANWRLRYNDWNYAVNNCGVKLLMGGNFGPYLTDEYYQAYHTFFGHLDDGCFRDRASLALFSDIPQLHYAPDLVLNLTAVKENIDDAYYVISAIDLTNRPALVKFQAAYESFLLSIIHELLTQEVKVVLMSFCEYEGDELVIQRLVQATNANITVKTYTTIDDALRLISQAKGIIATRFHAMILGWRYQIPTVPIIYSDKMLNVIQDYEYQGQYYEIKSLCDQDPKTIWKLLQTQPGLEQRVINQAQQQFLSLDAYLPNIP